MRYLLIVALALWLAACTGAATQEPPADPLQLVDQAAQHIRESQSFRMSVIRTGAAYFVSTDLGDVDFSKATAQYVAPDTLEATVRVIAAGLPTDVDIFSRGPDQWFRHPVLTADKWLNAPFAEGFNPELIISEDTGFQTALRALIDLSFVGDENLEDGTPVFHLKATAKGEDISALLANIVVVTGQVQVDVYIDQQTIMPVRFVIIQPDTVTDTQPDPTTWTVDIYDVNAEPQLDPPD